MIVDKHPKKEEVQKEEPKIEKKKELEEVPTNGMIEAYKAVRKILGGIRENPNDPNSPPLFKTIKFDNGQLARIKNNLINREDGIVLPAVFIHYIDVYYNQGTSGVSEGKGTMKIRYVLNRLNNSDDEYETEGMEIHDKIISAIESHKSEFPALVNRFQLQYWDQPLSFDDAVQQYWIDYQIWFTDISTYKYKDYVDVYVVSPPFTQHSDQEETSNPNHLPDSDTPKFEDCAGFED